MGRLLLLTALTMVAFASNSVLNRMALADGQIGPAAFGAIRLASGAVALAAIVVISRRSSFPRLSFVGADRCRHSFFWTDLVVVARRGGAA